MTWQPQFLGQYIGGADREQRQRHPGPQPVEHLVDRTVTTGRHHAIALVFQAFQVTDRIPGRAGVIEADARPALLQGADKMPQPAVPTAASGGIENDGYVHAVLYCMRPARMARHGESEGGLKPGCRYQ